MNNNIIEKIRAIAKKYPIEKIILFGSRARGDNKATSDIDLAIYPMPQFEQAGYLSSDIDEIETLLKIDIVLINSSTSPKLIENIEREGVVVYERL